jgi:uncharacterized protein
MVANRDHRGSRGRALGVRADETDAVFEIATVGALAAHSLALDRWIPAPLHDAVNLTTPVVLLALARREGIGWAQLGLDPRDAPRGAVIGGAAGALAVLAIATAAKAPSTQRFFHDERVVDIGRREAMYHSFLRIPVATAASEELLFRGVLVAGMQRRRSSRMVSLLSSVLFGLWHILPTLRTYKGNPIQDLSKERGRALTLGAAVSATSLAGGVFLWLRRRSGSLVAPTVAHAAINVSAFLIGRSVAERMTSRAGESPG